jgi:hypothetical protein
MSMWSYWLMRVSYLVSSLAVFLISLKIVKRFQRKEPGMFSSG